jgi:hypothetical protein
MAKATYLVVVIRKGREKDYFDFLSRDLKINANGEELHSDLVGFTEMVEARNKQEAVSIVEKKHPGLSIDTAASQRLG